MASFVDDDLYPEEDIPVLLIGKVHQMRKIQQMKQKIQEIMKLLLNFLPKLWNLVVPLR